MLVRTIMSLNYNYGVIGFQLKRHNDYGKMNFQKDKAR